MNFWEVTNKLASQKSIFKGCIKLWYRPHHVLQNTSQSGCLSLGINLCSSLFFSQNIKMFSVHAGKCLVKGTLPRTLSQLLDSIYSQTFIKCFKRNFAPTYRPTPMTKELGSLPGRLLWHLRAGSLITDAFSLNIMSGSFRFLNLGLPTSPSSCSCILLPHSLKGSYTAKWTRNLQNHINLKNINAW